MEYYSCIKKNEIMWFYDLQDMDEIEGCYVEPDKPGLKSHVHMFCFVEPKT
jgi:hypothetical protein